MDSDISQTTSPSPHPLSQTLFPHSSTFWTSIPHTKQKGHRVTVLLFIISPPSIQTTIYLFRSHPENIGFKIYAPHLLPCQKFSQIKSLAYMESMESLRKWKIFLTSTRRRRKRKVGEDDQISRKTKLCKPLRCNRCMYAEAISICLPLFQFVWYFHILLNFWR